MNTVNRTENARLELKKGGSSLEEADLLFNNSKYDGAVSRAYYAVFHYACEADYYPEITFTRKIAGDRLKEIKELVRHIRSYLHKQGVD